jgi:O-methyltransferase involved in polyketide biosynthesis
MIWTDSRRTAGCVSPEKVHLTGDKAALLATLYGRAVDARSPSPILGDELAAEVVGRIDPRFP